MLNVHPVYGAGIRTHDLLSRSLLPPKHSMVSIVICGMTPAPGFLSLPSKAFWIRQTKLPLNRPAAMTGIEKWKKSFFLLFCFCLSHSVHLLSISLKSIFCFFSLSSYLFFLSVLYNYFCLRMPRYSERNWWH